MGDLVAPAQTFDPLLGQHMAAMGGLPGFTGTEESPRPWPYAKL